MRVDLYSLVHKAQRFHLFRLADEIGKADFSSAADADRVSHRVREMLEHLEDHAHNEETYIHPLFAKAGTQAESLETDHQHLGAAIERIEALLQESRWQDLYAEYMRFLGTYLLHLDAEESAQKNVLWPRFTDAELAEVFGRFKADRPPAKAKQDLEFMLPALNAAELARVLPRT
jgi:hemerythrin superfamily protein